MTLIKGTNGEKFAYRIFAKCHVIISLLRQNILVAYLVTTLLQIFRRMCRWQKMENRSIFDENMDKSLRLTFWSTLYITQNVDSRIHRIDCQLTDAVVSWCLTMRACRFQSKIERSARYLHWLLSLNVFVKHITPASPGNCSVRVRSSRLFVWIKQWQCDDN